MRDCRLESIKAVIVIQRQQRMLAKGDDDGLLLKRQTGGFWLSRAGRKIGHRTALLPFCDGLRIDP
jgi:hypothetical protein